MRGEMKTARKQSKGNPKGDNVTKTISMPAEMWPRVAARMSADVEMDFSKYVRKLIRRDLEAA